MCNIDIIDKQLDAINISMNKLTTLLGPIQIGNKSQFPFGWRNAAKGRTVWRILEEAITQNLELHCKECGIESVHPSDSEVSVYDCMLTYTDFKQDIFVNIKSSVKGARSNKDDISKALGLIDFYAEDSKRSLFITTFELEFHNDMRVSIDACHTMPIAWLPDIYVNPSNNANLQSSKYKDINLATKRTNEEFIKALENEIIVANRKREAKKKDR